MEMVKSKWYFKNNKLEIGKNSDDYDAALPYCRRDEQNKNMWCLAGLGGTVRY